MAARSRPPDPFAGGELLEVLRLTPDLGTRATVQPLVRERCALFGTEPVKGLASVLRVETTDKLVVLGTNGRFYTLPCDRLPGGRGHGGVHPDVRC